jgi:hypothetical protein
MQCPKCAVISNSPDSCSSCGIIFSKFDAVRTSQQKKEKEKRISDLHDAQIPVWLEVSFPILAFLFAALFISSAPALGWALGLWPHEFGHAFAGWFRGVAATPFLGWTNYGHGQSWSVTICFSVLLGLLGYLSWKEKSPFLVVIFALMFVVQLYFRFALSDFEWELRAAWSGQGGEFWIGTLMIMAYHYRLPERTYWIVLRYVVLLFGAVVFFRSMHLWLDVQSGAMDIPWGALFDQCHGDMDQLRDNHAWTNAEIISSYTRMGYVCLTAIVVNYVVNVVRVILLGHRPLKNYDAMKNGNFE